MKCKICGKRTNTLKAMTAHYRKKHPSAMKRTPKAPDFSERNEAVSRAHRTRGQIRQYMKFCPNCGEGLGA